MAKFSYSISPDTGASNVDRYSSGNANHSLTITGMGNKNDSIVVSWFDPISNATKTISTKVGANGSWLLITPQLSDGAYAFNIKETGTQAASVSVPVWTLDTKTTVTISGPAVDSGRSASDGITRGGISHTVLGTAEAGDTVLVSYVDAKGGKGVLGTVTADTSGKWSIKTPVAPDGAYTVTALATDKAGNTATTSFKAILDSVAPLAPTVTVKDDAGAIVTSTVDNTLHVSGAAEVNSLVAVSWKDGAGHSGTFAPVLAALGTWSVDTEALAAGNYSFTAVATDVAGNASKTSAAFALKVLAVAPTLGPISQILEKDTGVGGDGITSDGHVKLSGMVSAGATVDIYDGATKLGAAVVAGTAWNFTSDLAEGQHDLFARATNSSGLTNESGHGKTITVDKTAPAVTLAGQVLVNDTGVSNNDGVTSDGHIHLTGTVEAGARVDVYDGSIMRGTANVEGTGWTFDDLLAVGQHDLYVKAADVAGNTTESAHSEPITVLETDPATAPNIVKIPPLDPNVGVQTLYATPGADNFVFDYKNSAASIERFDISQDKITIYNAPETNNEFSYGTPDSGYTTLYYTNYPAIVSPSNNDSDFIYIEKYVQRLQIISHTDFAVNVKILPDFTFDAKTLVDNGVIVIQHGDFHV